MSSAQLASIVHRGQAFISSSTVVHVLGLVQGYIAQNPLVLSGSSLSVRDRKSRVTCNPNLNSSLRSSRRIGHSSQLVYQYTSAARTTVEPEDLKDHADPAGSPDWAPDLPAPPYPSSLPVASSSGPPDPSLHPSEPLDDPITPPEGSPPDDASDHKLIDKIIPMVRRDAPRQSVTTRFPPDIFYGLLDGKYKSDVAFRRDWDAAGCGPTHLADNDNLGMVFDLFFRAGSEDGLRWLLELLPVVLKEADQLSEPHIHAILGYSLAVRGEGSATRELDLAEEGLKEMAKKYWQSPRAWAIVGLGWAKLREYDNARRNMARAMRARFALTLSYCPPNEAGFFEAYRDCLPSSRLLSDLLRLFEYSRNVTQNVFFFPGRHQPSTLAFRSIWFDALLTIPRPVEWAESQLSGVRTFSTKWIIMMLYMAMATTPKTEETLRLWKMLRDNGFTTPADATTRLAADLLRIGSRERALEVYSGITPSHKGLTRMLVAFVEAGMFEEAERTLQSILSRFKPIQTDWWVIAKAYADKGDVKAARSALFQAFGPVLRDDVNDVLILAHCNANDPIGAETCLDATNPTLNQINIILNLRAGRGELAPAVNLFNKLLDAGHQPNLKTYTALITLFAKRLDIASIERLLQNMRDREIEPDAVIWAALLNAEIDRGEWVNASKLWESLPSNLKSDSVVLAAVLRAFVYIAAPTDLVLSLFRQFKNPDTRQWALVMQSALDNSDVELARALFDEMDTKRDPKPDVMTYSILLNGYLRLNDGEKARGMYDELLRRKLIPTSITYSMIIQSFTAARSQESLEQAHDFAMSIIELAKAGRLPETGPERTSVTENILSPLVVASGRVRQPEAAKAYFDLARSNQPASVFMWSMLLDAYRRAGDLKKALETWKELFEHACNGNDPEEGGLRPRRNVLCIPLSVMLDMLSAQGRNTEVRELWTRVRDAGFGFDSGNYNHYAIALARTGDIVSAFHVVERVVLPRWTEVRRRRSRAMRQGAQLPALSPEENEDDMAQHEDPIDVNDTPVDIPDRPPNRRARFRFENPFDQPAEKNPESVASRLLESWRPSDMLWRPSLLLIAVLDQAYSELERVRQRAVIGLASDEGDGESLRLTNFGDAPVRDPDGEPTRSTPAALLMLLNRRYAKSVDLIMLYRRRRRSREFEERSGRSRITFRR